MRCDACRIRNGEKMQDCENTVSETREIADACTEDIHIYFMRKALEYAGYAMKNDDVPVGAVVVCDGEIVSWGYNKREKDKNAVSHAEIEAIDGACRKLGGWRLHRCDLYVTLEPCPMCAGAIVNARIKNLYFGASDSKSGAFGGLFDMNSFALNHHPNVVGGVCEQECSKLLSDFFMRLREKRKLEGSDRRKWAK